MKILLFWSTSKSAILSYVVAERRLNARAELLINMIIAISNSACNNAKNILVLSL